jgi:hypothetical protein
MQYHAVCKQCVSDSVLVLYAAESACDLRRYCCITVLLYNAVYVQVVSLVDSGLHECTSSFIRVKVVGRMSPTQRNSLQSTNGNVIQ